MGKHSFETLPCSERLCLLYFRLGSLLKQWNMIHTTSCPQTLRVPFSDLTLRHHLTDKHTLGGQETIILVLTKKHHPSNISSASTVFFQRLFFIMQMCGCVYLSTDAKRGVRSPGAELKLSCQMLVLETGPGSSVRVVCTLSHGAISPASSTGFVFYTKYHL